MQVSDRKRVAGLFLGLFFGLELSLCHAQQKPLFTWDDPNYSKKVAAYQKALEWSVATLPALPIKEGTTCKQGKDPALAFAQGDAHALTNVYDCGPGGWGKMPLQFSRGADTDATIKKADLEKMETWLLEHFPSLYNLGAKDATQAGMACDKKFEGVTGFKSAGGAHLSPIVSNLLRCEGGTWKGFPNLAELP